jgi:hypothetical protein
MKEIVTLWEIARTAEIHRNEMGRTVSSQLETFRARNPTLSAELAQCERFRDRSRIPSRKATKKARTASEIEVLFRLQ